MGEGTINLSVLLTKEATEGFSVWVARCLEYDMVGQGDSIDEAIESLGLSLVGHLLVNARAGLPAFAGLPQAPPQVWEHFKRASRLDREQPFRVPSRSEMPAEMRDAIPEPWQLPRPRATELRVW